MNTLLQLSVLAILSLCSVSSFSQTKIICSFGNFSYTPDKLPTVSIGDTIEWRGNFKSHPLTSDTIPAGAMPFGNSDGSTPYQYVITHEGYYSFFCSKHGESQGMRGSFLAVTNRVSNPVSVSGILLEQNYPNPSSGETTIGFSLEKPTAVTISLYSSAGEFIRTIASGRFDAGKQSVVCDISSLPNGVYIYRLNANGGTLAGQMVVSK